MGTSGSILAVAVSKLNKCGYVIITSGTTATPKGAIVEDRTFATKATAYSIAIRMEPTSRVLYFASYAFDAVVLETLTILSVGACIYVP
jgi:non-ribosomal peptide synthetase component F